MFPSSTTCPRSTRNDFLRFVPYASALDLIFNEGPRSLEILRRGRREPFTPDQMAARLVELQVRS